MAVKGLSYRDDGILENLVMKSQVLRDSRRQTDCYKLPIMNNNYIRRVNHQQTVRVANNRC